MIARRGRTFGRARPGAGARAGLGEWARREHGSDFVFVTGYPMVKRPFYTHPDPAGPAYSNGFDLLFRGLELVTGGQRLHRYDDYVAALAAQGEPPEPYAGLSGRLPPRHAAARRVRDRAGAVRGPAARGGQRPRGHRVPARPAPAHPVAGRACLDLG